MHDIVFIRQNPGAFDAGLARRGLDPAAETILAFDAKRREAQTTLQTMQNRRNEASKAIGQAMGQGDKDKAEALKAEVAEIKAQMPQWEEQDRAAGEQLEATLATLPNLPASDVPDGADEADNVEVSCWGTPRSFDFTPKEHADLGPALGMDFETGAKLSGARFTFLRGDMARLHRALAQFMLDRHTRNNGYTECNPPVLVNDAAMYGTDKLPKFAEDSFSILNDFKKMQLQADERAASVIKFLEFFDKVSSINSGFNDVIKAKLKSKNDLMGFKKVLSNFNEYYNDISIELNKYQNQKKLEEAKLEELRKRKQDQSLWLIPTSEVSLTASVAGQILPALAEPIRMTAHTLCFRSEAGAAGRDTRGFIRQHQFEKVELVSICAPQDSEAEHQRMTRCAEGILEALELPYRKLLLCTGDMGFGARKTYDLEVWLPGQNAYREISSCSNTGDFQARRMNARYRPEGSKKTEFVHTLNGSGLAVGRTLVAVLENYQQADGSVIVPQVLAPYMGGIDKLEPQ